VTTNKPIARSKSAARRFAKTDISAIWKQSHDLKG